MILAISVSFPIRLFSVRYYNDFILRIYVESLASVLSDKNDVLDTNADALVIDVDTRLYREALSYFDDLIVYQRNIAYLVVFKTDRVTCSVSEVLAEVPGLAISIPLLLASSTTL